MATHDMLSSHSSLSLPRYDASQHHTATFRVRSYECNRYGHVNNAVYLRYLQETALGALAEADFNPRRLAEMGLRPWMPRIDIEYHQPLFYGENVEVIRTARLSYPPIHRHKGKRWKNPGPCPRTGGMGEPGDRTADARPTTGSRILFLILHLPAGLSSLSFPGPLPGRPQ